MRRYLKTLGLFWSTAVAAEMEYRINFVLACITSIGHLVGSIFAINIFYNSLETVGGFTYHEALIIVGFFVIVQGLANTIMRPNLSRIVLHVRNGTLDFVLLKPIDAQFWLSFRNCSPWGLPNMLLGAVLVGVGGAGAGLGVEQYLMGLPALGLGMVMLYSLWFMLGSLSIWFVKVHNITHVLYQLLEAGRFPITAYAQLYQVIFTFVIPVAFLTTFPAELMIGRPAMSEFLGLSHLSLMAVAAAIAAAMLLGSRAFWRFALRFYTSASS